ncbi:MAG: hypothetical protein BGP21_06140 [Thiobacillus sp. 65-29]|nr:MAG: hypothetical protein BGP21_06140 [Thiobacillus sp. 65-29]
MTDGSIVARVRSDASLVSQGIDMNIGTSIRCWAIVVLLVSMGGGMNACADGTSWKEELLLHDGRKLIVERSIVRKGRHEPFQRPPIGEESLSFKHPVTHERIRWKDEYGDDVGMSNFGLLMLEVDQAAAYIVAEPRGCLSYNKWGRPNPPYVVFKFKDGDWKRIALQELPARFNKPNLVMSSPDDEAKQAGGRLITAEMVNRINTPVAAWAMQPQYKTILREAMKPGSPGVGCEELVYYKGAWVGPGDSIGRRMMDRMSK